MVNFVDYIKDPKAVAKIAEGFIEKNKYETAE